jgi:hypothetical protein
VPKHIPYGRAATPQPEGSDKEQALGEDNRTEPEVLKPFRFAEKSQIKNMPINDHPAGAQSQAPLSHLRLERIAALLRVPPVSPIGLYEFARLRSQMNKVNRLLGIKPKFAYRYEDIARHLENLLQSVLGRGKIDPHYSLYTQDGDVIVWVQPYHHPDRRDVLLIEQAGGFTVNPHEDWGFFHLIGKPNVYLIPAENIQRFEAAIKILVGARRATDEYA